MTDKIIEDNYGDMLRFHTDGHTKYIYFNLAVTASGIGLAVSLTSGSTLHVSQFPLGLAVILWSLSFFFGARAIYNRNVTFGLKGFAIDLARKRVLAQQLSLLLDDTVTQHNLKGGKYMRWQFSLLIAGAVAFIVWHVTEMYFRT